MPTLALEKVADTLQQIDAAGLTKRERIITTPQRGTISTTAGDNVLNLCANNYLGLADHPDILRAAHDGIDRWGFGLASVRFICGTQSIHKELEAKLSSFLGTQDTILYGSCFDANGGLFETILGEADAVISDQLNHASIIDGIRLCKARRYRYANNDMADLETQLQKADVEGAGTKLISTDGVFSMDGHIAQLDRVCDLADKYDALVHFDDCHATGFLGNRGRGTHEHCGVVDRIDITTGTLGKAMGGASGGYASGRKPIIDLLRQRSRPYLFSNSLAPMIASASIAAIDLVDSQPQLRERLWSNTRFWREGLTAGGFDIVKGTHPIVPVMFYDAKIAAEFAERLLKHGVYAVAFSFPVVPQGRARIRTQMSAALSQSDLERALEAFKTVKREMSL